MLSGIILLVTELFNERGFEVNGRRKSVFQDSLKRADNFFRYHSKTYKILFSKFNIKITDNDSSILFVRIENAKNK